MTSKATRYEDRVASLILVAGAQRSGTTWLAKIIDSHPDVLFRNEPNITLPAGEPLTAAALSPLLRLWSGDRSARAVGKRPFFRKSWQSTPAYWLHCLLAVGSSVAASRMPWPLNRIGTMAIPDLATRVPSRIAVKVVGWTYAAMLAEQLPDSRTILILRHPGYQIASVMRGVREKRFNLRGGDADMPIHLEETAAYAGSHGVDDTQFQSLSDAGKYAWNWRAVNEPVHAALVARPNALVVRYEDLRADPQAQSRRIMAFLGLNWHNQTQQFLARSTAYKGPAGYYSVMRDISNTATSWREALSPGEQETIQSIIADSPLAQFWPDVAGMVASTPGSRPQPEAPLASAAGDRGSR